MSSLKSAWEWFVAIPGALTALWNAVKGGLLVLSGVWLENDRETREQNAQTIKSLSNVVSAGNDLAGMSRKQLLEQAKQRGLLGLSELPPKS